MEHSFSIRSALVKVCLVTSGASSNDWLNCDEGRSKESSQVGFPVLSMLSEAVWSLAATDEKWDRMVCNSGVLKVDSTVFDLGV